MEIFRAHAATIKMTQSADKPIPTQSANSSASQIPKQEEAALRRGAADFSKLPPNQRVALAWGHTARFLTTASKLDQLPQTELVEIAFVGRSNAGKSTAINVLTQQGRLAYASKMPGRTQHINLFELGPKSEPNALFADLPGYGYAAVSRGAKFRWQRVMADYLVERRSLAGVVLMVDSRLGLTELDLQLLQLIHPRLANGSIKLVVLLTKADKLSHREAAGSVAAVQATLAGVATDESDIALLLFSALKKIGVGDAALALHEWVTPCQGEGAQLDVPAAPTEQAIGQSRPGTRNP